MTIHYHGTPISPVAAFHELKGRHFCVSFAAADNIRLAHEIGQSVMLDNGAFSLWRSGKKTNWPAYYKWAGRWLAHPTTWAVIPDEIDGGAEAQESLLTQWPFKQRGAPVWHMDEPIERFLRLCGEWSRVCIGSTSVYAKVRSPAWAARMDETFDALASRHQLLPWVHMLRGMSCCGERWPFASVDSTDIGRNHHRPQNTPRKMADRWDGIQCPAFWHPTTTQLELAA